MNRAETEKYHIVKMHKDEAPTDFNRYTNIEL